MLDQGKTEQPGPHVENNKIHVKQGQLVFMVSLYVCL
jgi:hypothetical protein